MEFWNDGTENDTKVADLPDLRETCSCLTFVRLTFQHFVTFCAILWPVVTGPKSSEPSVLSRTGLNATGVITRPRL